MRHHAFYDFDAFAESIRDIDARMILVNPTRHFGHRQVSILRGSMSKPVSLEVEI